jgi:predicted Fe-S protein YdhL (DUF1289 family)
MPLDGTHLSPTTQALIAGRRLIENGWCQGAMRSRDGVCAVGAIGFHADALRVLQLALGRDSIARWNDEPATTREDVLGLYDRAITLSFRI